QEVSSSQRLARGPAADPGVHPPLFTGTAPSEPTQARIESFRCGLSSAQGGFMRSRVGIIGLACLAATSLASAADALPMWAYGTPPAPAGNAPGGPAGRGAAPPSAPAGESLKHLPGSTGAFTLTQIPDG